MRTKNTLNGAQAFQVAKWLDENLDAMAHQTRAAVAAKAAEALGFPITEANILAAESTIGKSIKTGRKAAPRTNDTARLLARELVRLQEQLGINPHPQVIAIANR